MLRVNPYLDVDPNLVFRGFFIQARLVVDDSNVEGFLDPLAGQEYQLSSCVPSTVRTNEGINYCEVVVVMLLELARLGGGVVCHGIDWNRID